MKGIKKPKSFGMNALAKPEKGTLKLGKSKKGMPKLEKPKKVGTKKSKKAPKMDTMSMADFMKGRNSGSL